MSRIALLAVLLVLFPQTLSDLETESPPQQAYSAFATDPARRFDFWIGEWDINLRTLQDDLTFEDSVAGRASVYSILGGKAVLELWESEIIKRFSLRYYDPGAKTWELWSDWSAPNQSRLENLKGGFRHGRGEFRNVQLNDDGRMTTTVYSFSDITPFSLRWDDRYSTDGGGSWKSNWVMEYQRTELEPRWPIRRKQVPTYTDGERCNDPKFRWHALLLGTWRAGETSLEVYPILDGCAVMGFLKDDGGADEFIFLTFDSFEQRWVTAVLDDLPGTGFVPYSGADSWFELTSEHEDLNWTVWRKGSDGLDKAGARLLYRRGDRQIRLERIGDKPAHRP